MSEIRTVLPAVLHDLTEAELSQTLRFVLYVLGNDDREKVEDALGMLARPGARNLLHAASRLRQDRLTELDLLAEQLIMDQASTQDSLSKGVSTGG
jgi:hypothetical protein